MISQGVLRTTVYVLIVVTVITTVLYITLVLDDRVLRENLRQTSSRESLTNSNVINTVRAVSGPLENKTILVWGKMKQANIFGFGKEAFIQKCQTDTCHMTNDPYAITTAHAVLFPAKDVSYVKIPFGIRQLAKSAGYPERVDKSQIFVMFHLESPLWPRADRKYVNKLKEVKDVFNLTITYLDHPDTDIVVHRGVWKKHVLGNNSVSELVRNKSKMVAWVVSNCDRESSSRNKYVAALKRYIPVDVYGKCGTPCNDTWLGMDCFRLIEEQYKFYLAFENSFCHDYITEKMYRTLSLYVVPVALNGANATKFLPPHSHIDVRDFRSPRHLAAYLQELDRNDTKYMEYFQWKENYNINKKKKNEKKSKSIFCTLCDVLHNGSYSYKNNFDPAQYWDPEKYCKVGEDLNKILGLSNEK